MMKWKPPSRDHAAPRFIAFLLVTLFFTVNAHAAEPVWFDTVQPAVVLDDAHLHAMADYAWASLHDEAARFPDDLIADDDRRIVFISVSDGFTTARTQLGAGQGYQAAVNDALRWLPRDKVTHLRFDVVDDCLPLPPIIQSILPGWDRTRHGLALGRDEPLALLPAQIMAHRLVDEKRTLHPQRVADYLQRDDLSAATFKKIRGFRFTTAAAYRNSTGAVTLVAGHQPFAPGTHEDHLEAARLGAAYLARGVGDDGLFAYRYDADLDTLADDYNILRHGGAVWAMLMACDRAMDATVLHAAERAMDAMLAQVVPYEFEGKVYDVLPDGDQISLGANALVVLAGAQHTHVTGEKRYLAAAQRAAEFLVAIQHDSGRFRVHRSPLTGQLDTSYQSPFYPGEAVLALMTLYNVDQDKRWLNAASANARYLINVRDVQPINMRPDHWLLHGLRMLQAAQPHGDYPLHTLRLAQICMGNQHIAPPFPDWRGGYYDPPASTNASCRAEGLASGFITLREIDAPIIHRVRAAARLAADFAMRCQIRPELAMFMPNPQRALGGVMARLDHPEIQIDHNQHAIVAWLLTAQIAE